MVTAGVSPVTSSMDFDFNAAKARIESYASRTNDAYLATLTKFRSNPPYESGRLAGRGVTVVGSKKQLSR